MKIKIGLISINSFILLFLIISVVAVSLFAHLRNIEFAGAADEGYYLKYAAYIGDNGLSGFCALFKDFIQNQKHWLFPNPLRVGFIVLSALVVKIFGLSFFSLIYLSLFAYIGFLIAAFYFCRKYFDDKIALLLVVLCAFSPLQMAMARRALMDATANFFMILSIWFFYEAIQERRLFKMILFIVVYAATILVKEIAVLLSLFFVFYLIARKFIFGRPLNFMDLLCATVFPFGIASVIYIASAGGIAEVLKTISIITTSPHSNAYAIATGGGPWFRYIIDFMLLSPWVCLLAVGFCFSCVVKKEKNELIFYLASFLLISLFSYNFFTKNVRYVIALDMPIRLFSILMLRDLLSAVFKERVFQRLVLIVILIAVLDYANFRDLFVIACIYDPISYWLLMARHIIPFK